MDDTRNVDDRDATPTEASETDHPASIPTFLTREEYELIGDDPDPLPKGFEVIDGGAKEAPIGNESLIESVEAPTVDEPDQTETPDEGGSPTRAVGAFISEGVGAVRAAHAAKKAHASARDRLDRISRTVSEREAELERRRDIARRFDQIVSEGADRRDAADKEASEARDLQAEAQTKIAQLKQDLQEMKDEDAQTERRLRAAVEAAEAKEASSRESSSRLKRRLDDAQRALDKAVTDQESALEAAQRAIESAAARLTTLREEFAEVQRNPSANSAAYSVRSSELELEISDAAEELRGAQDAYPVIAREVEQAVKTAEAMLAEARKPIEAAKRSHSAVTAEADEAQDALETAKGEAAERQRGLREEISIQERELKAQERREAEALEEAGDAQALIDEAIEIHDHPERTEELARELEDDRALLSEQSTEVEHLAATERAVRERTRSSRLRFMAAIVAILLLIASIVVLGILFG